ncbi:MAG TPA: MlaD family protein [Chitinispirillaceae bacterium]|jgi:phospholipid/cholesterol/gamma-HCH transport system substrate-binding protein|nr:MlaD family protein [Chitinispirillaceae bacterium]
MSDRFLGYIILAVFAVLLLSPAAYFVWKTGKAVETRTVSFKPINTLNFLNIQDPVRVKGMEAGAVYKVYSQGQNAFVEIKTFNPIQIYRDYKITAAVKGLMGERYLEIDPGNPEKGVVGKDEVLYGDISFGPAEAIAKVKLLCEVINDYSRLSSDFKNGTDSTPSFISRFRSVALSFDSISGSVLDVAGEIDSDLGKGLDSLQKILEKTSAMSKKLSKDVPAMIEDVEEILSTANRMADKIDRLINQAGKLVEGLEKPELKEFEAFLTESRKNLATLRELIAEIQETGLKLPIRPR